MSHAPLPLPSNRDRMSVDEAASYLGISVSSANKWRLYGRGPVYLKLGRRVVYERAALDAWIATKRRTSTSDTGAAA